MATATLKCKQCGAAFTLNTSPANIKRAKYCSRDCAAAAFRQIPPLLESLRLRLEKRSSPQPNGCVLYTGQSNGTYGQIEYRRKTYLAHRAAYMVHKGEIPDGLCICHACDTPLCINPDHLWLGTYQDNRIDMVNKGRGRYNPRCKLSAEAVDQIRQKWATGMVTQKQLAREFQVSRSNISQIVNYKKRANVGGLNGLADRQRYYESAKKALGVGE